MRRSLTLFATFAFVVGLAGAADAAPCKDSKGRFIKCPAATGPCRDKTTLKFAKCGMPNTEPLPMKKK